MLFCMTNRWDVAQASLHRGSLVRGPEGAVDLLEHRLIEHPGASQVAATLLRQTGGQVAGASLTVLCLARGRQSESLLGTLVGLHLGHGIHPVNLRTGWFKKWEAS